MKFWTDTSAHSSDTMLHAHSLANIVLIRDSPHPIMIIKVLIQMLLDINKNEAKTIHYLPDVLLATAIPSVFWAQHPHPYIAHY